MINAVWTSRYQPAVWGMASLTGQNMISWDVTRLRIRKIENLLAGLLPMQNKGAFCWHTVPAGERSKSLGRGCPSRQIYAIHLEEVCEHVTVIVDWCCWLESAYAQLSFTYLTRYYSQEDLLHTTIIYLISNEAIKASKQYTHCFLHFRLSACNGN